MREGQIVFDFVLKVKETANEAPPVFTGAFASGPVSDRFVYLSSWAVEREHWINRVKTPLGMVGWELIRQAQATGGRITADMTDRGPGVGRQPVDWYLS